VTRLESPPVVRPGQRRTGSKAWLPKEGSERLKLSNLAPKRDGEDPVLEPGFLAKEKSH
jgi:hypothetical protein